MTTSDNREGLTPPDAADTTSSETEVLTADAQATAVIPPMAPNVTAVTEAPATQFGAPRTRWAGILWGLVLAALAGIALYVTITPGSREIVADWWLHLSSVTGVAYFFLTLGAIAVICAAVGIIGRAQRVRIKRLTQG